MDFDKFEEDWYEKRAAEVAAKVHEHLANMRASDDIVSGDADTRTAFVISVASRVAMEIVRDYESARTT